jgi:hypothetical protein
MSGSVKGACLVRRPGVPSERRRLPASRSRSSSAWPTCLGRTAGHRRRSSQRLSSFLERRDLLLLATEGKWSSNVSIESPASR